jgi:L-asparaginase
VLVVLNAQIQSTRWTTKTNSTSVQTFVSPDTGPIGYIDPASVRFVAPPFQPDSRKYPLPSGD